jgi:hypothetical protein
VAFRETLEFVANTLIFVLTGVIIAAKIYTNSRGTANDIVGVDYGYAVVLWLYLLVLRKPALLLHIHSCLKGEGLCCSDLSIDNNMWGALALCSGTAKVRASHVSCACLVGEIFP